jgi:hypothetical protein
MSPRWELLTVDAVLGRADDEELVVTLTHSECGRAPRVRIVEQSADSVHLRVEQDGRNCDDVGITSDLRVVLETALGSRGLTFDDPVEGEVVLSCTDLRHAVRRCAYPVPTAP